MTVSDLEKAIAQYKAAMAVLQDALSQSLPVTEAQVLNILIARDRLQTALSEATSIPDQLLTTLQKLDDILKQKKTAIAPSLPKLRPTFNSEAKSWWWHLEAPKTVSHWERWDWLCNGLSISFLTVSLGLVGEISSRFLSGGTDTLGAILVSIQGVLTLLTAGGILTKTGQEAGTRLFRRFNISEQYWHEIGVGLSGLLLFSLFAVRLGFLPILATKYSDWGWHQYEKGNLSSAEENYQRALSLNPDDAQAHFRLGLLYEELQNVDSARRAYRLAMQGGNQPAINNLARLYILDKNNAAAVSFITSARARFAQQKQSFEPDTEYALLKNLGWARLNQKDYDEARTQLDEAMNLLPKTTAENQNRADIHCLLAKIKDVQGEDAQEEWNQCNAKANPLYPEEDRWRQQAQKRLVEIYQQQKQP